MSRFKILGVALVAVFAVSLVVAAMASAVEFLLALWLLNNVAVSSPVLVDIEGDLVLSNKNAGGLGITVEVLCEGIFDGFVESESKDLITELLELNGTTGISHTPLVEPGLLCVDVSSGHTCAEPLVWAEELPWGTELELMIDEGTTFFVDLILGAAYYIECMSLKISELCSVAETATELINEANGTVHILFSDPFQLLAGLALANCTLAGNATGEVTGLGFILDSEGGTLAASSE